MRRILVHALIGATCGFLALFLIPPTDRSVGPATIAASGRPGAGTTELRFPPLGRVIAQTHDAPFSLRLALVEVDVPGLSKIVTLPAERERLSVALAGELRAAATRLIVEMVLAGTLAGAAGAALIAGRKRRVATSGAVGGALIAAILAGTVLFSFDVEAFNEPRFTGALQRAPDVIDALRETEIAIDDVRSGYERGAERLAALLAAVTQPGSDVSVGTTALLHVSDIHSNPLGIELVDQLAGQFDVDAIIDTGDFTSFGVPLEGELGQLTNRIGVPYFLVPGNHDSTTNEVRLDRYRNITVVRQGVEDVAGISVLGWADPTDTTWDKISTEEGNEMRLEEGEEVAAAVEELQPDVLAVHDVRMGEASIGKVPLILSGHSHEQGFRQESGTTILTVGSTGATGLGSFVESDRDYEAEIVYFDDGVAIAVDYVRFSGLANEFQVERRLITSPVPEG